jgi:hypothetical protein
LDFHQKFFYSPHPSLCRLFHHFHSAIHGTLFCGQTPFSTNLTTLWDEAGAQWV